MSGTYDPAAMDAKLDRILGQLTTITNRLNSHDHRLARIESGKGGVTDDAVGGGDDVRTDINNTRDGSDAHDDDTDPDRAWEEFLAWTLHDRERFLDLHDCFDRRELGRIDRDSVASSGRDYGRDGCDYGCDRDFECGPYARDHCGYDHDHGRDFIHDFCCFDRDRGDREFDRSFD